MILLLVGAGMVAGTGIGWVGYKANARIATWGRNMNQVDNIFRMAGEGESEAGQTNVRTRPAEDGRAKAPFVGQHLPTGPAASR